MFQELKNILSQEEILRLRELARSVRFIDGRATNRGSRTKKNLQVPQDDPRAEEPGKIVRDALARSREFSMWTFPKQVARPTLSLYETGMYYGKHVDEAVFPSQPRAMRSDMSCTVFVSDPADYDGGELVMHLGATQVEIKLRAGDAVVYPTSAIHEVREVTRGARLVAITWIHSVFADPRQREVMSRYFNVVGQLSDSVDEACRLDMEFVRTSLYRMWADLS